MASEHQKRNLAIIGTAIAAVVVLPLLYSVIASLISVSKNGPVPVPSSNPLTVSDESMWQTYINNDAGFSVSYPPELYKADTPFRNFNTTFLITDLKELGLDIEQAPRIDIFYSETPIDDFLAKLNDSRNKDQFPEFTEVEGTYKTYTTKPYDEDVIFYNTAFGNDEKSYFIEVFSTEVKNDALVEIYKKMVDSFEILENE